MKCKTCDKQFEPIKINGLNTSRFCKNCQRKKAKEKSEKAKLKKREKKENSYKNFEKKADDLWRKRVNEDWYGKCALCYKTEHLNAHHYIGRRNKNTRWYIPNGILLCAGHHKLYPQSAHENPEWFRKSMLNILSLAWLADITFKANEIWDKDKEKIFEHLKT